MVQTYEFKRLIANNRRRFDGLEIGELKKISLVEAKELGIKPFRERKEKTFRFKKQKGGMIFPNLY